MPGPADDDTRPSPPPSAPWRSPGPRGLPALREHLTEYLTRDTTLEHTAALLALGRGSVVPDLRDPRGSAETLLREEFLRLRQAAVYSVSSRMTDLAIRAGELLPAWNVRRSDLPDPEGWHPIPELDIENPRWADVAPGFMVFDKPIGGYARDADDYGPADSVSIVAASWGPSYTVGGTRDHLWMTLWSVTDFEREAHPMVGMTESTGRDERRIGLARARQLAREWRAELTWDNEALVLMDGPDKRPDGFGGQVDTREMTVATELTTSWMRTVRATWLLMRQAKMTEVSEQPLSKRQHRQAQQRGFDASPVRVVDIHPVRRRPRPTGGQPEDGRGGYTHKARYMRRAHWRELSPLPGEPDRRTYIDEYWAGPEDGPVRMPKEALVHRLNRPPADYRDDAPS